MSISIGYWLKHLQRKEIYSREFSGLVNVQVMTSSSKMEYTACGTRTARLRLIKELCLEQTCTEPILTSCSNTLQDSGSAQSISLRQRRIGGYRITPNREQSAYRQWR